jgi:hypothetical protein
MNGKRILVWVSLAFVPICAFEKTFFQYPDRFWSPSVRAMQSKLSLATSPNTFPLVKTTAIQSDTFPVVPTGKWERLYNAWGPDEMVLSIHSQNDTVVAAGAFVSVDRENASGVALWNGAKWNRLGSGLPGLVKSVFRIGPEVFAVGDSNRLSPYLLGPTKNTLTKWDGHEWRLLKGNLQNLRQTEFLAWRGETYSIDMPNGQMYRVVADSAQLIPGVTGSIDGFCALQGGIYLSGYIRIGNDTTQHRIVCWDGKKWASSLTSFPSEVDFLRAYGNELFFISSGTVLNEGSYSVWRFNPTGAPVKITTGIGDYKYLMIASDTYGVQLLQYNPYETAYATGTLHLSRWDGQGFVTVHDEPRFSGYVNSFSVDKENAYIGGLALAVNGQLVTNVAKWDGKAWGSLSVNPETGPPPYVNVLKSDGQNMYFGFYHSGLLEGKKTANGIASWNGTEWSTMNGGLQQNPPKEMEDQGPSVYDLAPHGVDLYVAGRFKSGGGKELNNIARWDGQNWQPLGKGLRGVPYKILVDGVNVFVRGRIDTLETETGPVYNSVLAQWNGSSWTSISNDENLTRAMAVYHGALYISRKTPDFFTDGVQVWQNGKWTEMTSFENYSRDISFSSTNSLNVFHDKLYFFGKKIDHGLPQYYSLAITWDGRSFQSFSSPVNMTILATDKDHFYGVDSNSSTLWRCDGSKLERIEGANVYRPTSAIESHQGFLYTACFGRLQNDVSMLPLARWKDSDFSGISGGQYTHRGKTKTLGAFHARGQDLSAMLSTLGLEGVEAYTPLGQKVLSIGKDDRRRMGDRNPGANGFLLLQGREK